MQVMHLYLGNGLVNPYLYEDQPFVIWGTGGDGERLWQSLPDGAREKVICFLDSDMKKVGMKFHGKPICYFDTLKNLHDGICVALAFNAWPEVIELLSSLGGHVFADYRYEHESAGERCIICGGACIESKAHFSPFIAEREFLGHPPETKLVTCKSCGLLYSFYRPSDEEMARLYTGYRNEEYYNMRHKHEPQYTRTENEQSFSKEYIISRQDGLYDFLLGSISQIYTILDYGGDEGQFIPRQFKLAKKYVFDISGANAYEGVEKIGDFSELAGRKFDFVMCCHLLEHVSDPLQIISNIVDCVADNGYLYIEVPFETKFLRYSNYPFSEHINFFTEETMNTIASIANIQIIKIVREGSVIRALYKRGNGYAS